VALPAVAPAQHPQQAPRKALTEKLGGKPASLERNQHTRLTIPVLWHPLEIDCRVDNRLIDESLC